MNVNIWSDFQCPFCYIGKKNYEKALENFAHKDKIKTFWHSFQLDPDLVTEPDKKILERFCERKNISRPQAEAMFENVAKAGAAAGIQFNLENQVVANSFRAHQLLKYAQTKNLSTDLEELLFKAQLVDGKNLDDTSTLIHLGKEASLSESEIENALASDKTRFAVVQDMQMAKQLGINAVPFFVFNDKYAVSGAQPAEAFEEVLAQAWQEFAAGEKGLEVLSTGDSCDADGNCD